MGVYIWKERLPSAYQEVEYIQSSGNGTNSGQFIKPGVSIEAGTKLKIEIDFQRLNKTTAERNIFAQYTGDTNRFQLGFLDGGFQARLNSATNGTLSVTWTPNTYAYNTRYLSIAEGTSNVASSRPPFLFAQNEGDSYGRWCISAKLYYCKIRKDDVLVRDFIPCYRKSDRVIGLYDLVNSTFYTNSGSGTFTKGQDINYVEHELKNAYIGEYVAPREPGANTVAYYKFDGNLNDSSGNNRNMSLYRGSVTYGTIGNNKYGHFDSSTWTNQVTIPLPGDFTFLMWVNPQYDYGDTYPRAMVDMQYNSSTGCMRLYGTIHPGDGTYYHINTNERHLIAYSYTNSTGKAKFYCVDKNYSEPGITLTHRTGNQKLKLNQIWDASNSNYTNNTYLSEIIIEDKVWTDQEISDYYNQTKANYGL